MDAGRVPVVNAHHWGPMTGIHDLLLRGALPLYCREISLLIASMFFYVASFTFMLFRFIAKHVVFACSRLRKEEASIGLVDSGGPLLQQSLRKLDLEQDTGRKVEEEASITSLDSGRPLLQQSIQNLDLEQYTGGEVEEKEVSIALVDSGRPLLQQSIQNLDLERDTGGVLEEEGEEDGIAGAVLEDDGVDKDDEAPCFSFKFEYQFSESDWSSNELDCSSATSTTTATTTTTTTRRALSNYRFIFMEEEEDEEKEEPFATAKCGGRVQEPFADATVLELLKPKVRDAGFRQPPVLPELGMMANFELISSDDDDGYSVKDLAIDSDSDDLLSETDVSGYECESDSTATHVAAAAEAVIARRRRTEQLLQGRRGNILLTTAAPTKRVGYEEQRYFLDTTNDAEREILNENYEHQEETSASVDAFDVEISHFDRNNGDRDWSTDEETAELIEMSKITYGTDHGGGDDDDDLDDLNKKNKNKPPPHEHVVGLGFFNPSGLQQLHAEEQKHVEGGFSSSSRKSRQAIEEISTADSDDQLECLWEHQDLIEQLRMELKKARAAFGLPTIMEEESDHQSPDMINNLKPWKIDDDENEKQGLLHSHHSHSMEELNKLYKTYRERMRKLDILNYQKMYAIGFLQLKDDPLMNIATTGSKQKPPPMQLLVAQLLRRRRNVDADCDKLERFMKELQADLETVYVGQMCLTWEFLWWQYDKARKLPSSDPYRARQYNQVAGEFQQFQVVMQRFLENESFQGPRLPNYIKTRCVLRNILQVPLIKGDCLEENVEETRKGGGGGAIESEMLEDIMEETIRVFWEFMKADRGEGAPGILKHFMAPQPDHHHQVQDPADLQLLLQVHVCLHKKEKMLRDILKTGNCIVNKFKKPQEDRLSNQQDLFFSQVDLKLVSRVLRMSRITNDQIVWCHMKLTNITLFGRTIHRKPSFLLFPSSN